MTDVTSYPTKFSAGYALGYGLAILRRRPISFFQLALIQTVVLVLPSLATIYAMGSSGQAFLDAGSDPVALLQAQTRLSLVLFLMNAVIYAAMAWIEAVWLEFFINDRVTMFPSISRVLWLVLAFIIVFAFFFAGYFVFIFVFAFAAVIAATAGSVASAVVVGIVGFLAFLFVALLIMSRFSALPAMAFSEKALPLGQAWKLAKARLGSLMLAWGVFSILYMATIAIYMAVLFYGPGPFGDALVYQFENLDNPYAQYEVYALALTDQGSMIAMAALYMVGGFGFAVLSAISRGIGAGLYKVQRADASQIDEM